MAEVKRRAAVVTIQRDEKFMLPLWIAYYSKHFEHRDMYILDHESSDPTTVAALNKFREAGGNVIPVTHPVVYASEEDLKVNTAGGFIRDTVTRAVHGFLSYYEYVLYIDSDEFVVPAKGTLKDFVASATEPAYRCTGREVVENTMHWHPDFDKTLLARIPLDWVWGFHYCTPEFQPTPELFMYHLHRLDFEEAWAKDLRWHDRGWSDEEKAQKKEAFRSWFYAIHTSARSSAHLTQNLQPLDERVSGVLSDLGVLPEDKPVPESFKSRTGHDRHVQNVERGRGVPVEKAQTPTLD